MRKQKKKFLNFRLLPVMLLVAIAGILVVSLLNSAYAFILGGLFLIALIIIAILKKFRKYLAKASVLFMTFVIFVVSSSIIMDKATRAFAPTTDSTIIGVINSDSDVSGRIIENGEFEEYYFVLTDVQYYTNVTPVKELDGKVGVHLVIPKDVNHSVGDKIIIQADIYPKKVNLTESVSVYNYISGVRYNLINAQFVDIVKGKASIDETIKVKSRDAMLKYIPGGEIMYSMVFGGKNLMADDFVSAVNLTGLAHLFAVSGLHLGLIAGIIGWICKKCKANKLLDYLVVLILSGLYALLVGFGPSVARAFLMLTIYKTSKLFGFRYCGISSLCLSGLSILLINPLTLFNMSFQLSFMAIIGLLFFSKPLGNIIKTKWKAFNSFVIANLSVNIGVLPILLHYFGSVSLIFLFANILIVPVATLVFPFICAGMFLSCIYSPLAYAILPLGYLFKFLEGLVILVAKVPFIAINLKLSIFWIILYVALLVVISSYSMISKKPKIIIASLMVAVIIVTNIVVSFGRLDGSVKLESVVTEDYYSIVMVDIKNEHYLVINGNIPVYALRQCVLYMSEKNIHKINGLVKSSFEGKEVEVLAQYKQALKIEKLITNTSHSAFKDIFGENVLHAAVVGDYILAPITNNVVELSGKGSRVLFVNNLDNKNDYLSGKTDLIYLLGNSNIVSQIDYRYLVNDRAVSDYIAQSVNTYFTFIIKNAKIKII